MATIQDIANRLGVSKGTVSKALNGAPDISETLQKSILETAVEMGYKKIRRQKTSLGKLCIITGNLEYKEPHQFGYDIILGFRQMAEPAGYEVDIVSADQELQKNISYDVYMLRNNYLGAFILGFSFSDPWMKEFSSSKTPAVLYDNYITANLNIAYVGVDSNEGMELAISHLKKLGHKNRLPQQFSGFPYYACQTKGLFPGPKAKRPEGGAFLCRQRFLHYRMYRKAFAPTSGYGNNCYSMQP